MNAISKDQIVSVTATFMESCQYNLSPLTSILSISVPSKVQDMVAQMNASRSNVVSRSLKKEVDMLGVKDLAEDLLMAYLVAVIQPKLPSNGESLLCNKVNACRSQGTIPVLPASHS